MRFFENLDLIYLSSGKILFVAELIAGICVLLKWTRRLLDGLEKPILASAVEPPLVKINRVEAAGSDWLVQCTERQGC
jgi:hypothetical protein